MLGTTDHLPPLLPEIKLTTPIQQILITHEAEETKSNRDLAGFKLPDIAPHDNAKFQSVEELNKVDISDGPDSMQKVDESMIRQN